MTDRVCDPGSSTPLPATTPEIKTMIRKLLVCAAIAAVALTAQVRAAPLKEVN